MAILATLLESGYIRGYRIGRSKIEILLKYKNQKPAIKNITRISKPSKRVY